ncbi:unnamed protein product [Spirodela intermedia]|uniref:Uncharacterized protein n=1 Tax=Spirodela intermedia TaxID=51605 RepID=A0A7I8KFI5_SPIIN|nr:unnamed protein product [Spirodela intermedia]
MAVTHPSATLVVAIIVLLACTVTPAAASYMTVWQGPGCNNHAERYSVCGCSTINLRGGYEFVYQGQTAAVYNQRGCVGVASFRFRGSARGCTPFGWQSIFIQC